MQYSPPKIAEEKKYNAIDLAKFICAILVVMIHVTLFGTTETTGIISYFNFGIQNYLTRIAVPFFFVTSGFLLYRKTSLSNFNIEFSKRYVFHIFRLYVIWSIIYFPLVVPGFFRDENGILHAVIYYIRDVIFVGSYTHLWYLYALMFAISIVSFLLYKNVHPYKIVIVSAMLYFAGLFAQSWFGFIVPLKDISPSFWDFLKILQKFIVTTRNGLFEGFFFVAIGMCFAFFDIKIEKKKSLFCFVVSMVLMFFEVFVLQYFHFAREYNMYLFLIPATFFAFCFIRQVELNDSAGYMTLRVLSVLVYYTHLWAYFVVGKLLRSVSQSLSKSFLGFLLTLVVSLVCSYIIYALSKIPKFKWLKKLYS